MGYDLKSNNNRKIVYTLFLCELIRGDRSKTFWHGKIIMTTIISRFDIILTISITKHELCKNLMSIDNWHCINNFKVVQCVLVVASVQSILENPFTRGITPLIVRNWFNEHKALISFKLLNWTLFNECAIWLVFSLDDFNSKTRQRLWSMVVNNSNL